MYAILGPGRIEMYLWPRARYIFMGLALAVLLVTMAGSARQSTRPASASLPNVVLLVLDTVRADHVSCYGYERLTTPRLDALAADGVLFENCVAPAPWTVPSHGSIFTGLYPTSHGAHAEHLALSPAHVTLAEVLRDAGYETAGFSANLYLTPTLGYDQGFNTYDVQPVLTPGRVRVVRDAGEMNALVLPWLENRGARKQPFFLFVNYMDAHAPYVPPAPYDALYGDPTPFDSPFYRNLDRLPYIRGEVEMTSGDHQHIMDFYDSEITYLDYEVGRVLDKLKELGLLDHTLVIIVSDHGEFLGEHHLLDHRLCLYEEVLDVPLVLWYPAGLPQGQRVAGLVQLTDVMPTVLDLVGITSPVAMQGRDLLPLIRGEDDPAAYNVALAEFFRDESHVRDLGPAYDRRLKSLRVGDWKYIWSSAGTEELYDLAADPGESCNLVAQQPNRAAALRTQLNDWLSWLIPAPTPAPMPPLSPDQREQLRSLGY